MRKLQTILRAVGASDGNMEQGSLRCDVNVSVHRIGEAWGTRTEIKNVNSVRFVMNAVSSEIQRQVAELEAGGTITQETRGYDEETGRTVSLRSKEEARDYRYMPDPNLPPLDLQDEVLGRIRSEMPESPDQLRDRLIERYGLSMRDLNILLRLDERAEEEESSPQHQSGTQGHHQPALAFFEAVAYKRNAQTVANWIVNELAGALGEQASFHRNPISAAQMGELIDLVEQKRITGSVAKALLAELAGPLPPADVAEMRSKSSSAIDGEEAPLLSLLRQRGQLSLNEDELAAMCKEVVADMTSEVEAVRKGKHKVLMRLVGEVMKRARGRADAATATVVLQSEIQRDRL